MEQSALKFLEELCNAPGPTGFEREPALLAKDYVKDYVDEIATDKLGSLIFRKTGSAEKPVILLPGHSDEIGFIVSGIHEKGYLKFNPLGGWPDQVLLAQRVLVMTKNGMIPGVIASKPPHVMKPEERKKVVTKDKMFIDIGCSNEDEVREVGVRIGDAIVPDSRFSTITKTVYKNGEKSGEATLGLAKALDNRTGLFSAAEVVRRLAERKIEHPNTVVGAATSQEEVGLRGATTTGYMVAPDVCLTLDVTIAGDVPGIEKHDAPSNLGTGVSICTYDSSMVPNQPLKEFVIRTAEEEKIPYTLSCTAGGGTDAGSIHKVREGCPSLYLGIPTRHIHSHVGLVDLADIEAVVNLTIAVVQRLDAKTVATFTEI